MTIKELAEIIRKMREDLEEVERILDKIAEGPQVVEVKLEMPEKKEPYKKPGKKGRGSEQKKLDTGKILALHMAGWNALAIAEEMRCSQASVYRVIKQEEKAQDEREKLLEDLKT